MKAKYDVSISNSFYDKELSKYETIGEAIYKKHQSESRKILDKFINKENGVINGSALKGHWFQTVKADIFLSHSHKDINQVLAFAGWLKEKMDLISFIDSCVWGYSDDLLRKIDDKYCQSRDDGDFYDYKLRNYSTSHVHMMLTTALMEMIDKTDCIMFYNTPSSISLKNDIDNIKNHKSALVDSPWIYGELTMMSLIRTQEDNHIINESFSHSGLKIEYSVDDIIKDLRKLNDKSLNQWKDEYYNLAQQKHALDILFSQPQIKGV